jgi:hypothetical protein
LTLIEILVAVSLLVVITGGLALMFGQTTKVFQQGTTQADVMEAGRAAFQYVTRDLAEVTANYRSNQVNIEVAAAFSYPYNHVPAPEENIILGTVNGVNVSPFFHNVLLVTERRKDLYLTGFWLSNSVHNAAPAGETYGFGTLWIFKTNLPASTSLYAPDIFNLALKGRNATSTDSKPEGRSFPLIDGVVHFRVIPYDTNGYAFTNNTRNVANNLQAPGKGFVQPEGHLVWNSGYRFVSNAVPAFLEVEMAILEPRAVEVARGMPNETAARSYLLRNQEKIHIFRKQIPIPSVHR